ncbi:MAG TPA: radical SAM protein [Propylenella sp.]|nr:radical SAM protein [Propylenella sp.]
MMAIWDRYEPSERICINLLLRCNLRCGHCNVGSHPERREALEPEEVELILAAAARAGKRHVTFSGGEPMLDRSALLAALGAANRLGLASDLETNAFWARSPVAARDELRVLADSGLQGLVLSADAFHSNQMALAKTIHAAQAAYAVGLLVEVNFCPSGDLQRDEAVLARLSEANIEPIMNPFLEIGRGASAQESAGNRFSIAELPACDSLTATVHADGAMFSCCEIDDRTKNFDPLPIRTAASWREDREFERSNRFRNLLERFYSPDSPTYFVRMVAKNDSFKSLNGKTYQSVCEFCKECFSSNQRLAKLVEEDGRNRGEIALDC